MSTGFYSAPTKMAATMAAAGDRPGPDIRDKKVKYWDSHINNEISVSYRLACLHFI